MIPKYELGQLELDLEDCNPTEGEQVYHKLKELAKVDSYSTRITLQQDGIWVVERSSRIGDFYYGSGTSLLDALSNAIRSVG